MKKKIFVMMLSASLAAVAFTGCTFGDVLDGDGMIHEVDDDDDEHATGLIVPDDVDSSVEKIVLTTKTGAIDDGEIDYEVIYGEVLDKMYALVSDPENAEWDYEDGTVGVWEGALYREPGTESVGYTFMDLNNDGVKELIIGDAYGISEPDRPGNEIYAVYSVVNEDVACITYGWARNAHYFMNDNSMLYICSNAYNSYGFGVSKYDGGLMRSIELTYVDVAPNGEDTAVFYNTDGIWDTDSAYLADMDSDDYFAALDEKYADTKFIELKPFAFYGATEAQAGSSAILPVVLDEAAADAEVDYYLDDSEYDAVVNFYANGDVTDLKFYKLTNKEVADDGSLTFEAELVVAHGTLKGGDELNVSMILPEITPEFAIGYVDPDGVQRFYAINMSGEDGSLYFSALSK